MSGKTPALSSDLLGRRGRALLRFLTRRVGAQDAPDLLQEAYLRVLRHGKRQSIADPEALLRAAAANLAKDHLRRRATERKYLDHDQDIAGIPAQAERPGARMEAQASIKLMLEALNALPPRCRQVFVMRRFQDLHQEEIARRLGISRNMVEKHMRLALERLRAALD